MPPVRDLNQREADALANMMGADSRRIDSLVDDVGTIKGHVGTLKEGVGDLKDGVNELRGAMTVLSRHSIALERQAEDHARAAEATARMDARLHVVEKTLASELPPLQEARTYAVRGVVAVLAIVGLALVALVIKR